MLHQYLQDELLNNKSLGALIYLIEQGRELEFSYNDIEYFISCAESKKYVSLWNGENEKSFDSIKELIEKGTIDGKAFLDVWSKVEIETLF